MEMAWESEPEPSDSVPLSKRQVNRHATVHEEDAADATEGQYGCRENVDQREAILEVGKERPVAHQRTEVDARHRVETTEVVGRRLVAVRLAGKDAKSEVATFGDVNVLPDLEIGCGVLRAALLGVVRIGEIQPPAAAGDGAVVGEGGGVAHPGALDHREVVAQRRGEADAPAEIPDRDGFLPPDIPTPHPPPLLQ